MPGLNDADDQLDDQNDELEDERDTGDDSGSDESAEGEESGDKTEKRVSDLQSRLDKETARANKAEKLLKAASDKGAGTGTNDPATAALMQELREASLDAIYAEFEPLKRYGIDRSLVEGTTRSQLRESASSLVALIKSVETKAKNEALADAGIEAKPVGATRQKPRDYGSMSDEEFAKLLDSM